MKRLLPCCLAAAIMLAGPIRPRTAASDYPAHETAPAVTIAAQAIAPDQARKLFATDLSKAGYVVFEVAIYPEDGKTIDVDTGDFTLRTGSESTMTRAASPQAIASVIRRRTEPKHRDSKDVGVYPSAEVGYESGGYDPATGRRTHGWYTGAGVGVGTGTPADPRNPDPGIDDRNEITLTEELQDKALPQGKISQPVAGYLYFPKPSSKERNALFEINWYGDNAKLRLSVPPASK